MKQLFEVVIADFKYYPQNNGEYTVLEVMTPEKVKAEYPKFNILGSIYYRLEGLAIVGAISGEICNAAGQPALRKKHIPGEFRYNELIKNLNTKIQERC